MWCCGAGACVHFPLGGGGAYRAWGCWGGWLLFFCRGAVRGFLLRSPGVPPGVSLVLWAVWDPCGLGLGGSRGGARGIGVSQPGGLGRVVPGCASPPVTGARGAGSTDCGSDAGRHVCGVCGPVSRGFAGALRPRCGARW